MPWQGYIYDLSGETGVGIGQFADDTLLYAQDTNLQFGPYHKYSPIRHVQTPSLCAGY